MNDGTIASGEETRSVDLLAGYLAGAGDHEIYEPQPGRQSLVARIEGTDPDAPSLLLMGHTDVVPVNPDGWSRDPFGAEVVDGFVWGRGAVDMLNLTASQAVAFRRLADSGFRPKGTLIYLAVADEEALGRWGADWLLAARARRGVRRLRAHRVGRVPDPDARGSAPPGAGGGEGHVLDEDPRARHARATARSRSAPTTRWSPRPRWCAASPSTGPQTQIHESWHQFVEGLHYDPELTAALLERRRVRRRARRAAGRASRGTGTRARTPRSRRRSRTAAPRPT